MQPSPAITSVAAPTTIPGVMPLWMPGLPCVTDARDAPVFDADVRFDDALDGIEDEGVGDDEVQRFRIGRGGRLAHAIADDLAAAELDFVAVARTFRDQVALDLDEQLGIREPHLVTRGGAKHLGVLPA